MIFDRASLLRSALPLLSCCMALFSPAQKEAGAKTPRVLSGGVVLERVAGSEAAVTPIGMAFDRRGRLFVVESHTHQRPDGYQGPAGDRVRMFYDSDGDGMLDAWSTFAEEFRQAMNLMLRSDGALLVVTRRDVQALYDDNDDGTADRRETIVRLDTEAEYPHNGLSGIALDPGSGRMMLGLGENFGAAYHLIGSDGSQVSDGGGVGAVFACTPDGADVERVAEGFWNPFSIVVQRDGAMMVVDNDPDASPPCRLLHVIRGGDYGHRWEYGRAGIHPLQAWDGELPGTLPMVCGTGEAPTAVVQHRGALWVTSWGDYRIERYQLRRSGSTYAANREVVVQGDAKFRPTGMAVAPDGSLYFADWVHRQYAVHGEGKIWRLRFEQPPVKSTPFATLGSTGTVSRSPSLSSEDPWRRTAAAHLRAEHGPVDLPTWREAPAAERLGLLQAMRWRRQRDVTAVLRQALRDADPSVRLYAVRWITERQMSELRDETLALLDGAIPNEAYYLAVLAAVDWIDGDRQPRKQGFADALLARELANANRPPAVHALALRLISPRHPELTLARLEQFAASEHRELRSEAIRALALHGDPERFDLLAAIATDEAQPAEERADAIAGLTSVADRYQELLDVLADHSSSTLRTAVQRIRQTGPKESLLPVDDVEQAMRLIDQAPGNSAAGRRLFFHSTRAQCGTCHQVHGRGGSIGPDLSRLREATTREKVVQSILHPSRDIAPRYAAMLLRTNDGKAHVGLRMPQGGDGGAETYIDARGELFTLESEAIEWRQPAENSIMPDGLAKQLTLDEWRDLIAFVAGPRPHLAPTALQIGQSQQGRPIECWVHGDGPDVLMVIATIHGNEAAGTPLVESFAEWLQQNPEELEGRRVVIVPVANPDGFAAGRRFNDLDVDLNRNFPAGNWGAREKTARTAGQRRGKPYGRTPLSEPESRAVMRAICEYFPNRIVSIHQPLACVDFDGPGEELAIAMADACRLPIKKLGARPGSLGSFVGEVLQRPIVTLELPEDAGMNAAPLWAEYGNAMISALRFPGRPTDAPASEHQRSD